MTVDEVVELVRTAFAATPAPADPADAADAALADCGIHLLGPDAVRYHVPRVVARALGPSHTPDDAAALDSLVFLLRRAGGGHARWQVAAFDHAQRAAALELLRFLKGRADLLGSESLRLVDRAIPLWERTASMPAWRERR
ncbi:MAG TPA: hypothetical protein VF796_16255 [Humisphaera sp.]